MQGGNDDHAAVAGEIRGYAGWCDVEVQPAIAQQLGEPDRRTLAVCGDDDVVLVGQQLLEPIGQTLAVTDDRTPSAGIDHRRIGILRRHRHQPRADIAAEQLLRCGMQAREGDIRVTSPCAGQRTSQVVLFVEQVLGPVAHPARLDQHHFAGLRQDVGQQLVGVGQPGQPTLHTVEVGALAEPFPLLATPRFLTNELGGPGADLVARQQFPSGEDECLVDVGDAALIGHADRRQSVDLVAPQVDSDRRLGRRSKDVDDRAAPRHFAAMLDQFLAPVAVGHQGLQEFVRIDDRPRRNTYRLDSDGTRPEPLQ